MFQEAAQEVDYAFVTGLHQFFVLGFSVGFSGFGMWGVWIRAIEFRGAGSGWCVVCGRLHVWTCTHEHLEYSAGAEDSVFVSFSTNTRVLALNQAIQLRHCAWHRV